VTGRDLKKEAIPKLLETMMLLEGEHAKLLEWSSRFGLCSSKKQKKAKK